MSVEKDNDLHPEAEEAGASTPLGKPGGLYNSVKMSVREANRLVVIVLALLAAVTIAIVAFGRTGFTVSFDTNGGTAVDSVQLMYGDTLPETEPPYREGYEFTGWYQDPACDEPWDARDTVTENITLYAGWQEKNQE